MAIRRYEHVLEIAPLRLGGAIDATLRFGAAKKARPPGGYRRTSTVASASLHGLLGQVESNAGMDDPGWYALATEVEARPELVLHPPKIWEEASQNLLGELVAATDTSWLARQEALSILLEHPDAQRHAVDACIQMIEDEANPAVLEAFSLLDVVDDQTANRYVLRHLQSPSSPHALMGALLAGTSKLRKGHFVGPDLQAHLPAAAVDILQFAETNQTLLPLTLDFCSTLMRKHLAGSPANQRFLHVLGGYRESSEWHLAIRRNGRKLCYRLVREVLRTHSLYPDETDSVLFGLVEDMLLNANPDAQLYASMLVAATPYRDPLASALITEINARLFDLDELIVAASLRALTIFKVAAHRTVLLRILAAHNAPAGLRRAAAAAAPHGAGELHENDWRRIIAVQLDSFRALPSTLNEDVLFYAVYGLFTDGHVVLAQEISEDDRFPRRVRNAAQWWRGSSWWPAAPQQ
ncbi:hypothetical protein [Plantactinospora soyae]|uniref:Uncharacterized protein n=1 Tax=Plantactinospora soyae TaxID=1544732 RepID=A0A927M1K8_9ACTN|nr:hypothetical protein [Plantactinospora soyae]MBE1484986.1 hypothetical protein [Plantactinospora soyae]